MNDNWGSVLRPLAVVAFWLITLVAVMVLKPLQVWAVLGGLGVGTLLLLYPTRGIILLFGLRAVFDLAWDISTPLAGMSVMTVFSGVSVLAVTALFLRDLDDRQRHEAFPATATLVVLFAFALLRQPKFHWFDLSLKYVSPLLLMFVVSSVIRRIEHAERMLALVAAGGAITVLMGIRDIQAGVNYILVTGIQRLVGPYLNITHFALALAIYVGLGVYGFMRLEGRALRLGALLYSAGAFYVLHHTYTRSAQIYVVLFVVLFFGLQRRYAQLGAALGVGVIVLLSSDTLLNRITELSDSLLSSEYDVMASSDEAGSGRLGLWRAGLEYYVQGGPLRWIFGAGVGQHNMNKFLTDTHNDYIALLLQVGPIGAMAYLWVVVLGIRNAWRLANEATDPRVVLIANYVVAAGTGMAVVNFVTNGFMSRASLAWFGFGALGVGYGLAQGLREQRALEAGPGPGSAARPDQPIPLTASSPSPTPS